MENNQDQLKQANILLRGEIQIWFESQKVAANEISISPEHFNYFIKGHKDLGPESIIKVKKWHEDRKMAFLILNEPVFSLLTS